MSGFVLGDGSGVLIVAAAFEIAPAALGLRWIRVIGFLLLTASACLAYVEHQNAKRLNMNMERIRQEKMLREIQEENSPNTQQASGGNA